MNILENCTCNLSRLGFPSTWRTDYCSHSGGGLTCSRLRQRASNVPANKSPHRSNTTTTTTTTMLHLFSTLIAVQTELYLTVSSSALLISTNWKYTIKKKWIKRDWNIEIFSQFICGGFHTVVFRYLGINNLTGCIISLLKTEGIFSQSK